MSREYANAAKRLEHRVSKTKSPMRLGDSSGVHPASSKYAVWLLLADDGGQYTDAYVKSKRTTRVVLTNKGRGIDSSEVHILSNGAFASGGFSDEVPSRVEGGVVEA